jgi:Holliday junction resolvase-like predicted endonuclease
VAANRRSGPGEIDLLVHADGRVVAVEVKTRIGADPLVQMTREKRSRMREAASMARPRPSRIDLVTVMFDSSGATIRWVRAIA